MAFILKIDVEAPPRQDESINIYTHIDYMYVCMYVYKKNRNANHVAHS